jgi:pyruvate dehydrogenase E1 component beta subunit
VCVLQHGIGAEIAAVAMEEFFDQLDAPMGRVAGAEIPTPYAANLEALVFPQRENIIHEIKRTLGRA